MQVGYPDLDQKCQKCSSKDHENIDAVCYCQKCESYMCNQCINFHSKLFQNHQTFKIKNDIKEKKEEFNGYCKEKDHFNTLDYFCKTHNVLCCAECIIKVKRSGKGQHSNCEIQNIEDIINEKKNKLVENISILQKMSYESSNYNLMAIFEKLNKNKEETILKIKNIFTKLRNTLNNRESELLSEIEKICQNLTFNEKIVKESEDLISSVNISLQKGKEIFNEWNSNSNKDNNLSNKINDCIILENNIKKINEIKKNIEKTKNKYNNEIEFIPNKESEINLFIEKINNFGKIKFFFSNIILDNKDEITEEEIKDPDNLKYLNTLGALDCKIKKLEDKRNNIDGRTPKELMQEIIETKYKQENLSRSITQGINNIRYEDYKNLLRYTFYHDKKLLEYFKNNKDQKKLKLVGSRLLFIIKEIKEKIIMEEEEDEDIMFYDDILSLVYMEKFK